MTCIPTGSAFAHFSKRVSCNMMDIPKLRSTGLSMDHLPLEVLLWTPEIMGLNTETNPAGPVAFTVHEGNHWSLAFGAKARPGTWEGSVLTLFDSIATDVATTARGFRIWAHKQGIQLRAVDTRAIQAREMWKCRERGLANSCGMYALWALNVFVDELGRSDKPLVAMHRAKARLSRCCKEALERKGCFIREVRDAYMPGKVHGKAHEAAAPVFVEETLDDALSRETTPVAEVHPREKTPAPQPREKTPAPQPREKTPAVQPREKTPAPQPRTEKADVTLTPELGKALAATGAAVTTSTAVASVSHAAGANDTDTLDALIMVLALVMVTWLFTSSPAITGLVGVGGTVASMGPQSAGTT